MPNDNSDPNHNGGESPVPRKQNDKPWLSAAFLLAIVTAAGYWGAFMYELGFAVNVLIPMRLIQLTPVHVLNTTYVYALAATLLGTVYLLLLLARRRYKTFASITGVKWLGVVSLVLGCCVPFLVLFIWAECRFHAWEIAWDYAYFALGNIAAIAVIGAMIHKLCIAPKDQDQPEDGLRNNLFGVPLPAPNRIAMGCMLIAMVYLTLGGNMYFSGKLKAPAKNMWMVPQEDSGMVVLRVYGDNVVCAKVAWRTNSRGDTVGAVKHIIRVLKLSEAGELRYRKGRLEPPER
ncbi:MAG: hypothetical protein QGG42_07470 [Phycisphaerae bacterium]|jgi:hypothetical protein|nr:hypothetical protein [Phycisphaerae bacterium]